MKTLLLYSTSGCHLCELAQEIVFPLLDEYMVQVSVIEISESDELVERFGVRIPVLVFEGVGQDELGWPFDSVLVRQYLDRVGCH